MLALALVACAPSARESLGLAPGPALAIDGVMLLDPVHGESRPLTLVIQGDRIAAVVEGDVGELGDETERVAGEALYVLPGFWDLHTHLAHADVNAAPLLVVNGVTGIRDLGAVLKETDALRAKIDSGELLGPRIVRTGPTLNGALNAPFHRVIATPDEARAAVEELAAVGVDLLKTHNATEREPYFALIEAAGEAGLDVVGHVPTTIDPVEACRAGQRSIEHIATIFEGTYIARFDSEMQAFLAMDEWLENDANEIVACFAEHQTLFVPTLRAYEYRAERAAAYDDPAPGWKYITGESYEQWRENSVPNDMDRREEVIRLRHSLVEVGLEFVRRLHQAGSPVGAGTDMASPGLLPGFDLLAEIRLLADAVGPRDALHMATRGPGESSGGDPLEGQLVVGAPADLVLVGANAFESLDALDDIRGVVLRGDYLDRAELDAILAGLER